MSLSEQPPASPTVRLRIIALGVLLVFVNAYWFRWAGDLRSTTQFMPAWSLFANALALLFVLTLANHWLMLRGSRLALHSREVLVLYIMLTTGTSICAGDFLYYLPPTFAYGKWAASQDSRLAELFAGALPSRLVVNDLEAVRDYFLGDSSFYQTRYVLAWLTPLLLWCAFLSLMFLVMFCINRLVLSRWSDQERLAFPLATVPLLMTVRSEGLLEDRRFWIGMAIAFAFACSNSLREIWPALPTIPTWFNLTPILGQVFPWSMQRHLWLEISPFTSSMAFLAPRELLFSLWLFNLLWRIAALLGAEVGLTTSPYYGFPYYTQVLLGGAIALTISVLWLGRRHLKRMLTSAFTFRREVDPEQARTARFAILGLALALPGLAAFLLLAGLSPLVMLVFAGIYLAIFFAVTRLRVELGPPSIELTPSLWAIVEPAGTLRFSQTELGIFTLMTPLTFSTRSMPMGVQLEGMYLMSRAGIGGIGAAAWVLLLAGVAGLLASFWSALDVGYRVGVLSGKASTWAAAGIVPSFFTGLASLLSTPTRGSPSATAAFGAGAAITMLLTFATTRIVGWPLHPTGFILGASYLVHQQLPAIFVAWLVKSLVIRYGGIKTHRSALRVCVGILVGSSCGWIFNIVFDQIIYAMH